jgi:hypothetical protein
MMNDIYGHTLGTPLTRYDPNTQSWRTSPDTSLWDLEMSSLTLPQSGSMLNGELFERQMLARPTEENGYLSLPTPTARDYKDHQVEVAKHRPNDTDTLNRALAHLPTLTAQAAKHLTMDDRGTGSKDDHNLWSVAGRLLPTPNTMDHLPAREGEAYERMLYRGGSSSKREASGNLREVVIHSLLPTPRANNAESRSSNIYHRFYRDNWITCNIENVIASVVDPDRTRLQVSGATTPPQSNAGNTSLDDPHQPQLFNEMTDND